MIRLKVVTGPRLFASVIAILLAACAPAPTPPPPAPATATQPALPTDTLVPVAPTPAAAEITAAAEEYLDYLVSVDLFRGVVLIGRDGDIVFEKAYGMADEAQGIPNTLETRFGLGSVTKQFTAMAILILQAQGKLEVHDPICNYLSNCPPAWSPVTIHHLLTHTSGIPGSIEDLATGPDEVIALNQDQPLLFAPGSQNDYKDQNYILLGQIVADASGVPYAQFMQASIFEPLGMSDTSFECADARLAVPYNYFKALQFADLPAGFASAGGLCTTAADLFRWDQALYTEQLVPQALLDLMYTAYVPIPPPSAAYDPWGYGYGTSVGMFGEHTTFEHPGVIRGYVALIARYPDDGVVTIVLSNQANLSIDPVEQTLARLMFPDL